MGHVPEVRRCVLLALAAVIAAAPACNRSSSSPHEAAATPAADPPAADPAAGHALLGQFARTVNVIKNGDAGQDLIDALDQQIARGQALAHAGKVSAAFARRHQRLLKMLELVLAPDPDGSHRARTAAALDAFATEVEGGPRHLDPDGGLAAIGPILVDELVNLHMLLDGTTDRAAARARYLPTP